MDKDDLPQIHMPNIQKRLDIPGYADLEELALDMHWSWNHRADKIWRQLDPFLWDFTHNPWVVLQTVSREKLKDLLANPTFRQIVDELVLNQRKQEDEKTWFQKTYPQSSLSCVAYFSMEYMLSEALPIYSGGLGNVAGDQMKAASDLGIPIVAIGLLYQQGYFRQSLDKNGSQEAFYPYNDPGQLPIFPLRKSDGEWLRFQIDLPGASLWVRTWQVKVGRVVLYLLDSNDPANLPIHRAITSELYGGEINLRIQQEILLGIGGWRLLEIVSIRPEVCHLNEGHAAFAILERTRSLMQATGKSFETALTVVRAGNLFTTHTAVPAGFDLFPPSLIEQYLGGYAKQMGISLERLLALGRQHADDQNEPFNMAYLAIRGSGAVNAVSRLHGKVSRRIFDSLFPRWPEEEVPIGFITNGVHTPSWDSPAADELWTELCGKDRWKWAVECLEKNIAEASNLRLWQMRNESRKMLIEYMRQRLARQWESMGVSREEIQNVHNLFDETTLTLGFARRFTTYKRPDMLLHNPERFLNILNRSGCPVQILIAGKAHPADKPGQAMIQKWMNFIRRPEAKGRVVFLSDYDMLLTEKMVQGVDVWLNTPRRPWEACGTSGMKVLVNGGLNFSELDGWWAEAYSPEVGWAIGDGQEHGEDVSWDAAEANQLYELLEKEVVPAFYQRNEEGFPMQWLEKMRASMTRLTPYYSANRAVREYTENYYLPAAKNYRDRTAQEAAKGEEIVQWKQALDRHWPKVRFGEVRMEEHENQCEVKIQVYLDGLSPHSVKLELYAEEDGLPKKEMKLVQQLLGEANSYLYSASIPKDGSINRYTPRIVPYFEGIAVPLEESHILWQK